ncbi:hypothetical protein BDW59DRAFT_163234 [Aspergillus cavernicola]|uniref:FAD-binding domain-containing protein n=1 Tax=Aspergillus cavernicola TaxID=176166 RepID=A0ABR4I861_9EURO
MSTPNTNTPSNPPITVAIIGNGVIGSALALGLHKRNIRVKVYEQAQTLRSIGAGIAFTKNARECLALIDPRLDACVTAVGTVNGDPRDPNNNMQFVDGYTHDPVEHCLPNEEMVGRFVFKLFAGERGFEGCHRAQFLEGVMEVMPEEVVCLGRRLERYCLPGEGENQSDKIKLVFGDGGVDEADIVIGCDGIKSRVRQLLYGRDNPISHPHYTHKVAYRGLVPMNLAISHLGSYRALNQHMYGGPNAHVLHFPVADQKLMNVVAFVNDLDDWPLDKGMTQPASKDEIAAAFVDWGPTVKGVIELLLRSKEMDKWGVFDMYEYPAPRYAEGRVCIAGDAAHASAPHHGAGAGIGVEDALALCVVLERAQREIDSGYRGKVDALGFALKTFSDVRYERSQWLVRSSREVCETYEWVNPECGKDMAKGFEDVKARSHQIWYFDIEGMVKDLQRAFDMVPAEDLVL